MLKDTAKDTEFDLILTKQKFSGFEQVFEHSAREMSERTGISSSLLFKGLMDKKRFERSLVGEGLVMSDMRVRALSHPFLVLMTLDERLDFGAPDGVPVNVVSFLLSPAHEGNMHLRRVFRLSRLLKNADLRQKLVEADDEIAVRSILTHPEGWMIAA